MDILYRYFVSEVRAILEKLAEKQPGPLPTFTAVQVLGVLLYLGRTRVVGRKKLSGVLEIGEGAVRNILGRLRSAGLIEVERRGCRLSEKGLEVYRRLAEVLVEHGRLEGVEMPWQYPENYSVLVKDRASKLRRGLEQRDAAIRAGAEAVMILVYRNGCLHMPGVSNISKERPEFAAKLVEALRPGEGDVVIIAAAGRAADARNGALAAAQTLL